MTQTLDISVPSVYMPIINKSFYNNPHNRIPLFSLKNKKPKSYTSFFSAAAKDIFAFELTENSF